MGALGAAAAALAKQASWLPARQQRIRFDLGSATRGLQNLVVFGQTPALQLQEAALFACHSLSKRPEASPSVWQPLSRNPDVLQNSWARGMSTWRGFAAAPLKAAHAHQRSGFTTIPPKPPVGMSKMAFYVTEYGLAFSIWWTTAWIISGFGVYALISSGAVGGADAIGLLKAVGIDKLIDVDGIDPRLGNMAITIAINEALEVVRLPLVLATTPYVASLLPRGAGGPGLGDLIRSHGLPFLSLWGGTYLLTGGAIWGVLESGLLGGADAVTILKALPFIDQVVDVDSIDPTLGNFALAITINELLEVVRLPLAVALTPAWARLLSKLLPRR